MDGSDGEYVLVESGQSNAGCLDQHAGDGEIFDGGPDRFEQGDFIRCLPPTNAPGCEIRKLADDARHPAARVIGPR